MKRMTNTKVANSAQSEVTTLGFQVDRSLLGRVDRQAQNNYVSRSVIMRWAILDWLKQHEQTA